MTFDQLEMLEAIVKCGSFQAAAKSIHKSQPSLSVGIKKLEEEFQIKIFSRNKYRPQLTEEGQAFFDKAQQALSSFRNLENLGKELGMGVEPEIIFSIDSLLPISKLKNIFDHFINNKLNTILKFESDILTDITTKLLQKKAVFGIGGNFLEEPNIEIKFFDKIHMIPVIHKSRLKQYQNIETIFDIIPQTIVTSNQKNSYQIGIHPHSKKWYVSNHTQKEDLILNGFGWGYLPKYRFENKNVKDHLIEIDHPQLKPNIFKTYIMRNTELPLGPMGKKIWNSF